MPPKFLLMTKVLGLIIALSPTVMETNQTNSALRKIFSEHLKKLNLDLVQSSKNIHQARVTYRRIQAALSLARHADKSLAIRKLENRVKRLCKNLTSIRELEVAKKDAKNYNLKIPHLNALSRDAHRKAKKRFSEEKRTKTLNELRKLTTEIRRDKKFNLKRAYGDLRKSLVPWAAGCFPKAKDSHAFRIKVKKVRYSLELIGCPEAKKLAALQKHLGRAHDLMVLQRMTHPSPGLKKQVMSENLLAQKMVRPTVRLAQEVLTRQSE